jgi:hypothetical protein
MNQEQKDTIREEFKESFETMIIDYEIIYQTGDDRRFGSDITDWWLNKLDQAYQDGFKAGAKDKVEEVRGDIKNYSETRDNSEARGAIWDILDLPSLKDNT